jgi:hypothetical protein
MMVGMTMAGTLGQVLGEVQGRRHHLGLRVVGPSQAARRRRARERQRALPVQVAS